MPMRFSTSDTAMPVRVEMSAELKASPIQMAATV